MNLLRSKVLKDICLLSSDSKNIHIELASEADLYDGSVGHCRRRHEKDLSNSDVEEVQRRICRATINLVCVVVKKSKRIVLNQSLHICHMT